MANSTLKRSINEGYLPSAKSIKLEESGNMYSNTGVYYGPQIGYPFSMHTLVNPYVGNTFQTLPPSSNFNFFHPPQHVSPLPSSPVSLSCVGKECFTCERAALQAIPENTDWKRKVQKSMSSFSSQVDTSQTQRGSFTLDSIKKLKPAEREKSRPCYIYDEKLGRKRRHDPWFAKHHVDRSTLAMETMKKECRKTERRSKHARINPIVKSEVDHPDTQVIDASPISLESSPDCAVQLPIDDLIIDAEVLRSFFTSNELNANYDSALEFFNNTSSNTESNANVNIDTSSIVVNDDQDWISQVLGNSE